MSDKVELLPCAFCGANGTRMMRNFSQVGGMDHHYLFCDGCGTCGPSGRTEDQARAAWAMRPVDSAPKATHIEWIPMSEQWPPIGEDVLIACAGKGYPDIGADRLDKGDGTPGYDPELYYWQGGEDFSEVTHWAPLPAMPGNTATPAAEQPKCITCRDSGIVGHSDVCPVCADTWTPAAEQPYSTTSDRYRAELYDEAWEEARALGFGNVTEALSALARQQLDEQPDTVKVRDLLKRYFNALDRFDREGPVSLVVAAAKEADVLEQELRALLGKEGA